VGHLDIAGVSVTLPDGRPLLHEVTFRVGEGSRVALVGPNGTGKTTLLRVVAGDLTPQAGAVVRSGGLGVMRQEVGRIDDDRTVGALLASLAAPAVRAAAAELAAAEDVMLVVDDEPAQLRYAQALADWADVGGYEAEAGWDEVTDAVLSVPYERAQYRAVRTLSGGEQKRLVLEALLRGPDEVLLLDEPDNALDVPTKRWLEERLLASGKTVLFVSHDRELLDRVATHVATLEPTALGAQAWVHGGGFGTYQSARADRTARLGELRRRWDEEHAQLRELVATLKQKATYNADMASRYQAARTRLRRFEEAGPPQEAPRSQHVRMRLAGGRTAKRAVVVRELELTGLMRPFDLEVWYGERVAVLGSNGSGKSHFLRLLAAGGTDPGTEHVPVDGVAVAPVAHAGSAVLGSRVRPGWFAQNHPHPELVGRTLLEALEAGLAAFDGTVLAVTHDRWFARGFDRFLVFGADGTVAETPEPVWDTGRVERVR
jgi:ATPase subunit of ABC transporter with duplicated ATPase domains